MAGFDDPLVTQEFETAKLKLRDTKHVLSEMQKKIQQLQVDRETNSSEHKRKMKNLSNIEATQELKLAKLSSDIANGEAVLNSRLGDLGISEKHAAENQRTLNAVKEETDAMIADFQSKCRDLEDNIKGDYLQIQTEKDMEYLMELTQHILKDNDKIPYLYETITNRKELILKRRQDNLKELADLERLQNDINKELTTKQKELAAVKEKHSALTNHYVTLKKLKRDHFSSVNPRHSFPPPP